MRLYYWFLGTKIFASISLIVYGMYMATTNPGPMDVVNGAVTGIALYAIWRPGIKGMK